MKTVLLIPVRNEVETIGALVTAALNFVDKIIVDEGGSTDGTMRALREIWQTLPDPSVLTIAGRPVGAPPLSWIINDKAWLGELMADGYFCLATMDAGGTHDPEDLPGLQDYISGAGVVALGTRDFSTGGAPWYRRALSYVAGRLIGVPDATCGFRAYNMYWLLKMPHLYNKTGFDFHLPYLVLLRRVVGEAFAAHPVPIEYKVVGRSSLRLKTLFQVLWAGIQVSLRRVEVY